MDRKTIIWVGVDWIHLARDSLVADSYEHVKEHFCSVKCVKYLE
jgi:hypothetical protein